MVYGDGRCAGVKSFSIAFGHAELNVIVSDVYILLLNYYSREYVDGLLQSNSD